VPKVLQVPKVFKVLQVPKVFKENKVIDLSKTTSDFSSKKEENHV